MPDPLIRGSETVLPGYEATAEMVQRVVDERNRLRVALARLLERGSTVVMVATPKEPRGAKADAIRRYNEAAREAREALEGRSPAVRDTDYLVRLGPPGHEYVIHRASCRYARTHPNALRWVWADRMGFENIDWDMLRRRGIRPCSNCDPEALEGPTDA